jgi:hypothetical protein
MRLSFSNYTFLYIFHKAKKEDLPMSLYQDIKEHFSIPEAFQDWTAYRETLTAYLIDSADTFSVPLSSLVVPEESTLLPSLLIIGAGCCNDLDLGKIAPHFSSITLLDKDLDSMKKAIDTYHLEQNHHIHLLEESLNGITDSDYETFCEEMQHFVRQQMSCNRHLSYEEFENFSCDLLKTYLEKSADSTIPLSKQGYDYVWCVGVHSQLHAMFSYIHRVFEVNLRNLCPDFPKKETSPFDNKLKEENNHFIPLFHNALLQCARQKLFIGLEIQRAHLEDADTVFPPAEISDIEGASQGLTDLQKRKLQLTEHSLFWPFRPKDNLYYQMQLEDIQI